MELEDFVSTDQGLMVRGASPDLLEELLTRYEALQRAAGWDPDEFLRPGLSREDIITPWAERGVQVPEEIVRLWQWHNGGVPGRYPGTPLDSIEQSLGRWDQEPKGLVDFLWDPAWITVAMGGAIAVKTSEDPPLVRDSSGVPILEVDTWDRRVQVVSFCTIVAMGIYGRERDFYTLNSAGLPHTESDRWPRQLEITKIYGW